MNTPIIDGDRAVKPIAVRADIEFHAQGTEIRIPLKPIEVGS